MTETMPALLDHCSRVYAAMLAESTEEEGPAEEGEGVETYRAWEGHTTKIFAELSLAAPYYTAVMKRLKEMGCVEQMQRGGGSARSKWVLIQEPTLELFENALETNKPSTLKQRVTSLEKEVAVLRHNFGVIANHLGVKL